MRNRIITACIAAAALFVVAMIPMRTANAQGCYYCNPLWYPFAVVGTVVNGAVVIGTAPFQPFYYERHHRVWVPGHVTVYGHWAHGHWRYYR
ncbi:MAG: hypothetical protein P4L43_08515 [Syntrophobacteraceae bacterium]|nr:hypothetical protein [Syntrophobacteraceae bacterium]